MIIPVGVKIIEDRMFRDLAIGHQPFQEHAGVEIEDAYVVNTAETDFTIATENRIDLAREHRAGSLQHLGEKFRSCAAEGPRFDNSNWRHCSENVDAHPLAVSLAIQHSEAIAQFG